MFDTGLPKRLTRFLEAACPVEANSVLLSMELYPKLYRKDPD